MIGEPHWGYENKFKEWSIDVYINESTEAKLKAEGLGSRIKTSKKGDGSFITFKRKEFKADGITKNDPIRIVDDKGNAWDGRKIGNGSVVRVNFAVNEYGKGQKAANILSLQVWDHVAFDNEFPTREEGDDAVSEDDWTKEIA